MNDCLRTAQGHGRVVHSYSLRMARRRGVGLELAKRTDGLWLIHHMSFGDPFPTKSGMKKIQDSIAKLDTMSRTIAGIIEWIVDIDWGGNHYWK